MNEVAATGSPARWLLVAAILAAGCGAGGAPAVRRPDVVLISVDSLRADHLGAYGYGRPTSPNIDRLAAEGVLFENAYSTTTWTLPSHVSMLTGLYPEAHRVQLPRHRLGSGAPLLSELLAEAGYQTLAVVSGPFMSQEFGFDRGFEVYDDRTVSFPSLRASHRGVTAPRLHQRLLEVLDGLDGRPFFLFVHYWDVHYDYAPPPPWNDRFDPGYEGAVTADDYARSDHVHAAMPRRDLEHVLALYDGEIGFTDRYLGRLLAELERRERLRDALIVLTADHGDEFFEHGRKGHYANLYDTTLRVPLIVRLPGSRGAGRRVAAAATLVDLVPTVLEVAGLEPPAGLQGASLLPTALDVDRRRGPLFADLRDEIKAVVMDGWKLIRSTSEAGAARLELYDLRRDPAETDDRSAAEPQRAARMGHALDGWLRLAERRAGGPGPEEAALDERLRETLEGLGYLD